MKIIARTGLIIALLLALPFNFATASDACSGRSITTTASVKVSDGSTFETESFFQSADVSAIRHIDDETQTIAVEGPLGWISRGDKAELGGDPIRGFALGHQYHALLLHFEEILGPTEIRDSIAFQGEVHRGRSGDYPYGGKVSLVESAGGGYPAGFVFEFPDSPPMEISFGEWREVEGRTLPFLVRIDDGTRVFDYNYISVSVSDKQPGWFFSAVGAPDIDELQILRLHRDLLVAHCNGDAGKMAELTTPESVVASRGEVYRVSRESTRERFLKLFERLDYQQYHDIIPPIIEVSDDGSLGWIAVNVRAEGTETESGAAFDAQWAWIMLAKKLDGVWLNAGNASNWQR